MMRPRHRKISRDEVIDGKSSILALRSADTDEGGERLDMLSF